MSMILDALSRAERERRQEQPHALDTGRYVPQMWFWTNWSQAGYSTEDDLNQQLQSFSDPIPFNNHIPRLIRRDMCF